MYCGRETFSVDQVCLPEDQQRSESAEIFKLPSRFRSPSNYGNSAEKTRCLGLVST